MKVCEIPDVNVSEPMWLAAKTAHVLSNRVGEKKELAKKKWKKPTKKQTKKKQTKNMTRFNLFWEFYPFTEIFLGEGTFLNNIIL